MIFMSDNDISWSMIDVDESKVLVFKRHSLIFPLISQEMRRVLSESNDTLQIGYECAVAYGDDFKRLRGFLAAYLAGSSSGKRRSVN